MGYIRTLYVRNYILSLLDSRDDVDMNSNYDMMSLLGTRSDMNPLDTRDDHCRRSVVTTVTAGICDYPDPSC